MRSQDKPQQLRDLGGMILRVIGQRVHIRSTFRQWWRLLADDVAHDHLRLLTLRLTLGHLLRLGRLWLTLLLLLLLLLKLALLLELALLHLEALLRSQLELATLGHLGLARLLLLLLGHHHVLLMLQILLLGHHLALLGLLRVLLRVHVHHVGVVDDAVAAAGVLVHGGVTRDSRPGTC